MAWYLLSTRIVSLWGQGSERWRRQYGTAEQEAGSDTNWSGCRKTCTRICTSGSSGQDEAIDQIVNIYQMYLAGMNSPGRPIGNFLFLGPTGSGKTRLVEATAESLVGDTRAMIKIDCAEFQHSHEIAKLIGSPPGYLGHRETHPLLSQEVLNQYHTEKSEVELRAVRRDREGQRRAVEPAARHSGQSHADARATIVGWTSRAP